MSSNSRYFLFQGVFVSDEELKKTYLQPENIEDQVEVVRHPDEEGEMHTLNHLALDVFPFTINWHYLPRTVV